MSETEAVARDTGGSCRRCGEPVGTFHFCLHCGAAVDADELGPAEGAAGAPTSRWRHVLTRLRRWRTQLVVFPLLAALAVAAGIGAQMLMEEIPRTETAAQFTCWDGNVVGAPGDCSAPTGVEGLRWVFPTFHPNRERDDCVDVLRQRPDYPRPAMFECGFKVMKRWVRVSYIQLAEVEAGRRYFEKEYAGRKREKVRTAEGTPYRYVWRKRTADGYRLAAMYKDFPFAVEIVAPEAVYRDQALRDLEFRHPDRMRVAATSELPAAG